MTREVFKAILKRALISGVMECDADVAITPIPNSDEYVINGKIADIFSSENSDDKNKKRREEEILSNPNMLKRKRQELYAFLEEDDEKEIIEGLFGNAKAKLKEIPAAVLENQPKPKEEMEQKLNDLQEKLLEAHEQKILDFNTIYNAAIETNQYIYKMVTLTTSNDIHHEDKLKYAENYSNSYIRFINKKNTCFEKIEQVLCSTLLGSVILAGVVALVVAGFALTGSPLPASLAQNMLMISGLSGAILFGGGAAACVISSRTALKNWAGPEYKVEVDPTLKGATKDMKKIADYGKQLFFKKPEESEGIISRIRNFVSSEARDGYSQVGATA